MRGRKRVVAMRRQQMKTGRRGRGCEGTRRQRILARRRARVGNAVAEPVRKWMSPASKGATGAATKMLMGLEEDISGIVVEVMR